MLNGKEGGRRFQAPLVIRSKRDRRRHSELSAEVVHVSIRRKDNWIDMKIVCSIFRSESTCDTCQEVPSHMHAGTLRPIVVKGSGKVFLLFPGLFILTLVLQQWN